MSNAQLIPTDRPRLRAGVWTLLPANPGQYSQTANSGQSNQLVTAIRWPEPRDRPSVSLQPNLNAWAIPSERDEKIVTSVARCARMTTPAQAEVRLVGAQGINLVDCTIPGLGD